MTPPAQRRTTGAFCLGIALLLCPLSAAAAEPSAPTAAARVGWAYGIGAELEYRPRNWGVGVSGGYVPQYGPGGYLSALWGANPLGSSGLVAEAGLFYGQHNPLRAAQTGLGAHALVGYEVAPTARTTIRLVAGAGVPFTEHPSFPSGEFLAKLTAGITL